jgi:hypothetical protein
LRLDAMETRTFPSATAEICGEKSVTGALRIESEKPVITHARLFSIAAGENLSYSVASSFNAIPTQFAAGIGETATLQGIATASDFHSRVFLVETAGVPLVFTAALLDTAGHVVAMKREYMGGFEQRSFEPRTEFPTAHGETLLRIRGMSGGGRLIAGAVRIANASQDGTAYEMSLETAPRWRIPPGELVAYVIAGLTLISAIVFGRRGA